jgi:hypothetical protein
MVATPPFAIVKSTPTYLQLHALGLLRICHFRRRGVPGGAASVEGSLGAQSSHGK